ncbi:MAG: chromate efflux transporter [Verrucomicrobia bacterium]|nr:chromate efflux transporter [Verrucomicrobiota bacterium]
MKILHESVGEAASSRPSGDVSPFSATDGEHGSTVDAVSTNSAHTITLLQAFWVWCRVAVLSFGGPAGQIAVMHRILVEEKRWVSENRFLHALNYCMLLPGPEVQQLATYIGWLLHRTRGGLMAGTLFVLPGFVSILVLSVLYAGYKSIHIVDAFFYGLAPAVMAIVVDAVLRIGRRALKNGVMVLLAALAFVAIFFMKVPFPVIVVVAGAVGLIGGKLWPSKFIVIKFHQPTASQATEASVAISDEATLNSPPTLGRAVRVLTICLILWFAPLIVLWVTLGWTNIYVQEGVFFSKAAVVTFGGAYAVLAYMAQQAVDVYGWLQPGEMLDGLGMAETTPGPLIQVVQFVGFMGAYQAAAAGSLGAIHPMLAGMLAAILVTWVTFVPCFLWIFLGAPYIERLRGNQRLTAVLSSITAAVVGVVLNLAVWFSFHKVFGEVREMARYGFHVLVPQWATLDWVALAIATCAFVAMFKFKAGMIRTLAVCVLVGLLYRMAMA